MTQIFIPKGHSNEHDKTNHTKLQSTHHGSD